MKTRIIDLSYPIHEGMTTFPCHWHPKVEIKVLGRHGVENRETRRLILGTHTGTHCDAPKHFIPNGQGIDKVPLDVLIGQAFLIDFSDLAAGAEISKEILIARCGDERSARMVFRFDWSQHWGSEDFYKNHPYFSQAAAHWLVEQGVRLVAIDTPMPDNPQGNSGGIDSPIHKILLSKNVLLVEYLCNLNQVTSTHFELIVMPLNIVGGDGSPARCVAVVRDE